MESYAPGSFWVAMISKWPKSGISSKHKGIPYHDRDLGWKDAKLSAYADVLNDEEEFVGIELESDIAPPARYKLIDHHNENSVKASSIEQVAEMLGIELSREQQLIAANDKGFIPALEVMGASMEKITNIRKKDREAQGITKADELLGKKSIRRNLKETDGIIIIESLTSRFATITDRLYPYKKLMVYTNDELSYYGEGRDILKENFDRLINEKKAFYGGIGQGYFELKKRRYSVSWRYKFSKGENIRTIKKRTQYF